MPDHAAMSMPLMPSQAVAVAVFVLLAVCVLHVAHARAVRGLARWWHAAHVSMSVGMIIMFLVPHHDAGALYGTLAALFGAHSVAMALAWRRVSSPSSGMDRRVWVAGTVDQLLMVYMLAPLTQRPAVLTYAAVAYLVVAAVAWLLVPEKQPGMTSFRGDLDPGPGGLRRVALAPSRSSVAVAPVAVSAVAVAPRTSPADHAPSSHLTTGVRLTLTVMSLAMAWMFVSMQLMPAM